MGEKINIMIKWQKWLLIAIGTITWSWTMVKSGWLRPYGMGFWGANGHDGIWHLALAESLSRNSLATPVFAGQAMQNYHIGFDLLLAALNRLTAIPIINIYFQLLPPILAVLIGVLTYRFVLTWTKSSLAAWWSTFFTYFGGGFGWILGKGESAFWSQGAISTLVNPPFALSLIFILTGLMCLLKYIEKPKILNFILCCLFFGLLIEIKVYAGLLVLLALAVSGVFRLLKYRDFKFLILFMTVLTVSVVIYILFNKISANLLVWQPFWFLETMMGSGDRFGWERFYSAMMTYKSGHVWMKGFIAYVVAFAIFLVGNMGVRIIGKITLWKWFKDIKNTNWVQLFVASIIIAGGIIPMLFLQKGTPWNTIQFFYYSLFFGGILAGVAVSEIFRTLIGPMYRYIYVGAILVFTLPTTSITLKSVYIPSRPPAMLSYDEISALTFLSKQPDGIVLTYPFDADAAKSAENNPPRPLYLYISTAYVAAFSRHLTFLEDEINLDITGYDWGERRNEVENWYKETNKETATKFLKGNQIKYIYWVRPQKAFLGEEQLGLKNIFENSKVTLYRVE
jgi:hypothetical protein